MANHNNHPEAPQKKPTATESVDNLIGKTKAKREAEVSESVTGKMTGVQEEVSEIITGAEKPSEKVSKRAGEKGEGRGPAKGKAGTTGDDDQVVAFSIKDYHFPSEEIMVRKVRTAINAQIKLEWKKAKKFRGNLGSGGANGYNRTISKIRELKQLISTLFTATFSYLKNMYVKYFTPDGKRRRMEEIQ